MATAETVVREFWRLMATNDFASVDQVLAEDVVVDWPQSNERIRGPKNFGLVNTEYPASGTWRFTINRMVAGGQEAVTHVSITDGVQTVEAISFFTVLAGKIARIVEFWPEPFEPATNRRHLTEPLA